jgi:membrane protein
VRAKLLETLGFLRFVLRRWSDDRCPQIAGSLTYTTLLALAPMFAIVVAVLSSSSFFGEIMSKIKIFLLLNLVPEVAGQIITVYIPAIEANAVRLTWVGLAAVLVVAIWLMLVMDRSINAIWRVRRARPYWVSVLGYAALLLSGPILIGVSVTITTYILNFAERTEGTEATLHALTLRVVPIAMSTIAFFMIYRIVPHRAVPWRHALLGGFVAAVLFEFGKQLFGFYVHESPTYHHVYGAFAAVPVFLVWLYLSWMVVLFGAELTASAAYWRGGLWRQAASPGMRFREAAMIVRALVDHGAGAMSFEKLREATLLPADELEETLAQMVDGGVLRRAARHGYALAGGTRELLFPPARPAPPSEAAPTKRRRGRGRSAPSSR